MSVASPQQALLKRRVEAIGEGMFDRLERLDILEPAAANEVLCAILEFCCASQHVGSISAGRAAFDRLPVAWVSDHMVQAIRTSVNVADAWEYRRLLELLHGRYEHHLREYVAVGANSADAEIREVADDFS